MYLSPTRLLRLCAAVLTLIVTLVVTASVPAHAAIEDYAEYDGQSTCASDVLPGTAYLLSYLVRTNPGTAPSSLLRACDRNTTSEHQDGRALDWAVDATVPEQRAIADRFLARVFAADGKGNQHALARRMGIMYIIWNDNIYRAYHEFQKDDYTHDVCVSRDKCSKTLRHRDHVHISLSRSGAAAQTSFYRSRGVRSVPVLYPRTNRLDPVRTALVKLTVPSTGRAVTTDFNLTKGETYRVVASGRYRHGPGSQIGDAACTWSRGGWAEARSLLVNGTRPWTTSCDGRHTHTGYFTASATEPLKVKIAGDGKGHQGSLTFALLREDLPARSVAVPQPESRPEPRPARRAGADAKALRSETVTVRAAAAKGGSTVRAFRKRHSYRVVVTGTARSGDTTFDGNCVRYAGRLRAQHTLDLARPTADHLSVYLQGVRLELRAPASRSGCDATRHRYVGVFEPVVGGKARVRVWDPYTYADNTGTLNVRITRR